MSNTYKTPLENIIYMCLFILSILISDSCNATDLKEAVKSALSSNHEIESAKYECKKASLVPFQSAVDILPTVSISSDVSFHDTNNFNTNTPVIEISGTLFQGATEVASYKRAKKHVRKAEINLNKVTDKITLDAINAYINMLNEENIHTQIIKYKKVFDDIYRNLKNKGESSDLLVMSRYMFDKMEINSTENLKISENEYINIINIKPANLRYPSKLPHIPTDMETIKNDITSKNNEVLYKSQEKSIKYFDKTIAVSKWAPKIGFEGQTYLNTDPSSIIDKIYNNSYIALTLSIEFSGQKIVDVLNENIDYKKSILDYQQCTQKIQKEISELLTRHKNSLSLTQKLRDLDKYKLKSLTNTLQNEHNVSTLYSIIDYLSNYIDYQIQLRDNYKRAYKILIMSGNTYALDLRTEDTV